MDEFLRLLRDAYPLFNQQLSLFTLLRLFHALTDKHTRYPYTPHIRYVQLQPKTAHCPHEPHGRRDGHRSHRCGHHRRNGRQYVLVSHLHFLSSLDYYYFFFSWRLRINNSATRTAGTRLHRLQPTQQDQLLMGVLAPTAVSRIDHVLARGVQSGGGTPESERRRRRYAQHPHRALERFGLVFRGSDDCDCDEHVCVGVFART